MKKKAIIYIPAKTSMQSGRGKLDKWVLKFKSRDTHSNTLMGWESSDDTLSEIKLEFFTKEKAIEYANENDILYELRDTNKRSFVIKSYADNFTKN